MKTFQDGAYAMAALSAAVVAFRILVKKGLLTRDEAVRSLLDEAVQRAIFAARGRVAALDRRAQSPVGRDPEVHRREPLIAERSLASLH